MTRIFWTVSLAALCVAGGCGDLEGNPGGGRGAGDGQDEDLGLGPDGTSSCDKESLDAEGCACSLGEAPRACYAGGGEHAGNGACTFGTQTCETSTSSEVESSAWGPCSGSIEPAKETCGDGLDDDCNGVVDDCDGGGDENAGPCCSTRLEECLASGEPAAVCDVLLDTCETQTCEGLMDACDPTSLPVSAVCARVFYQCRGFRVNKCKRESFDSCMAALNDEALCTAWDAACTAREDYCAELTGSDGTANGDTGEERGKDGGQFSYPCTDWGHIFDPCWAEYTACGVGEPSCLDQLNMCISTQGDIYAPFCETTDGDGGGDTDKEKPPEDPDGGSGGSDGDDPPKP